VIYRLALRRRIELSRHGPNGSRQFCCYDFALVTAFQGGFSLAPKETLSKGLRPHRTGSVATIRFRTHCATVSR
jgi:hypothetical protein